MSENIPFEIQMEIIKRLPVKSLFQFRSVSKTWKSLIDSPQFIADYNVCQSRPQRLFIRYEEDPFPGYKYEIEPKYVCIVDDDIFPQHKFAPTIPTSLEQPDLSILIGSSQGLFCFLAYYRTDDSYWETAIIWNPAIRKSIVIDVPVIHEMYTTILGFGVCPNTDDLMLIKINDDDDIPWQVEVFPLSLGVWRDPLNNVPRRSIVFSRSQVAIEGFIYWLTFDKLDLLIVSFDMESEEFREINLPKCIAYRGHNSVSVSNLRESLAVLEHYTEAEKPVCAVWIMEHGVLNSFTKLYTVTAPNAITFMKVRGFRKNGEPILETRTGDCKEPAQLQVYEPRSKHIKDLGICGEHVSFYLSSYTETLLLL